MGKRTTSRFSPSLHYISDKLAGTANISRKKEKKKGGGVLVSHASPSTHIVPYQELANPPLNLLAKEATSCISKVFTISLLWPCKVADSSLGGKLGAGRSCLSRASKLLTVAYKKVTLENRRQFVITD